MNCEHVGDSSFSGFIEIWKTHKESGCKEQILSQPNKVLIPGATMLARALAGNPNSFVNGIRVGYTNVSTYQSPIISTASTQYGPDVTPGGGGLINWATAKLNVAPVFQASSGYSESQNVVVFTAIISSALQSNNVGEHLQFANNHYIFDLSLVSDVSGNILPFSRTKLSSMIQFTNVFDLTVLWGVKFTA